MDEIQIDLKRIPRHIAIIMDGNGRWATSRGLPRTEGHKQGVETVRRITEEATRLGVEYLTLYTFSTENWRRPSSEVAALMGLVLTSLQDEIFMRNNVRFRMIGDMSGLPAEVQQRLRQCEEETAGNTRMTLVTALNYSSRQETTAAARALAAEAAAGKIKPADIDEQAFAKKLYTAFMPEPELLIRTGGELRLSNFLLWQCAYSELYFTDTYWPDFGKDDFCHAIACYQQRQRRFGRTEEQAEQYERQPQQ